jgi:hypothetical protein
VGRLVAVVGAFFGWRNRDRLSETDMLFLGEHSGGYEDLFSECARLRERARRAGVELDDTPGSLDVLDHLLTLWQPTRMLRRGCRSKPAATWAP